MMEEEDFQIGDSEDLNNDTYRSQEDSCKENPAKANKSSSQSKMNSKKKATVSDGIKEQMKSFVNVANTSTEVVSHMAKKNEPANSAQQHMADKDWDFAKFLYHKIREVPEGNTRDELQLNIQQMIYRVKRECSMQRNPATIPCQQAYQQPYAHNWLAQGQGTSSAEQCTSRFSATTGTYTQCLVVAY